MLITTNSILSFITTSLILPSALGAALTDFDQFGKSPIKKRSEVNYVWTLANGDIAPVRITFTFNTVSAIKKSIF